MFVGRKPDLARIEEAFLRAPLTLVWGLGGLGKTATVLRLLHSKFAYEAERALFVRVPASDGKLATMEVIRALIGAERREIVDWSELLADEQRLIETTLELAERSRRWIVIDDLHHSPVAGTESLLRTVARYARTSRWIATSRTDWAIDELVGQRVALGTLDDEALGDLARKLDAGLDPARTSRLVNRAAGSPWRMRMSLGHEPSGRADDIFGGLAPEAVEFMHVLYAVEMPLPRHVLVSPMNGTVPPTRLDTWLALERRGIVERIGDTWRLHDMARALLREVASAERLRALARPIAEALALSDEPAAWLESLRLFVSEGAFEEAAEVMRTRGDDLLGAGYGLEAWHLLERVDARALARWRLRCGVVLGTPEVLGQLNEPPDPTPDERTLWGHALFEMGQMREAAAIARRALTESRRSGDVRVAFDAELLYSHAQALADPTSNREVLAMLQDIAVGQTEVQRKALAAKCFALMGVFGPVLPTIQSLGGSVASLPDDARLMAYLDVLAAHLSLGRMLDADEVLGRIERECGGASLSHYSGRYLSVLAFSVHSHRGRLAAAHDVIDKILPYTGRSAVQRPILVSMKLWMRLQQGDLAGIEDAIQQVNREFGRSANEYFAQWGGVLESLYQRFRGRAELPSLDGPPSLDGAGGNLLRIYRLVQRARRRQPLAPEQRKFLDGLHHDSYFWALGRIVVAMTALLAGDGAQACDEASAATEGLARLGNEPYLAEARETLCEALLVSQRLEPLAAVARELERQGQVMSAPRLVAAAELYQMAASGQPIAPAALERLARLHDSAPTTSRRARALLGGSAPLDAIDELVVAALLRDDVRVELIGGAGSGSDDGSGWAPGWGLDGHRRTVWLPEGRVVSFDDYPILWRCLEALATLGGAASREELVPVIWPGERYDPRIHNNRINPAIRRLRLALEVNAAEPRRLLTTADGYGFGRDEPVRWLRGAPTPSA